MTRHLIETNAQTTEDVLAFASAGYTFNETETTDTTQPVFVR